MVQLTLAIIASTGSVGAWAADKACLIEGDIVVFGKTTPTKDCLENSGVPDDRFKAVCQSLVQASENLAKNLWWPTAQVDVFACMPAKGNRFVFGIFWPTHDQPL